MSNQNFSLPELSFFGGETQILNIHLYKDKDKPIDATTVVNDFSIINYSDRSGVPLISKRGTIIPESPDSAAYLRVTLNPEDTASLFGKYIYQIAVKDERSSIGIEQGILMIKPNINKNFTKQS